MEMNPLLIERMAQMHREELLLEAAIARFVDQAHEDELRNRNAYERHRELWSSILGLPLMSSSINQEWLQRRMHATIRIVSLAAFGVGILAGSFLGSRFGLLPAVVFSSIVCLLIALPILARLFKMLKEHLLLYAAPNLPDFRRHGRV